MEANQKQNSQTENRGQSLIKTSVEDCLRDTENNWHCLTLNDSDHDKL
jgi:hypothetical protein